MVGAYDVRLAYLEIGAVTYVAAEYPPRDSGQVGVRETLPAP
jgi:hypothetical protein